MMNSLWGPEHPAKKACREGVISKNKSFGDKSYPRMEIDHFCQDPDRLNLYLLALIELQKNDKLEDIWSYFRLSALHGLPAMVFPFTANSCPRRNR